MFAALLVSLSVAALLAYFAKAVLSRPTPTSSESATFGSSTGLSNEEQRKYQEQILRKRKQQTSTSTEKDTKSESSTVMQPPQTDLAPPKDDPFTVEQLKQYDGSDPSKPIYVAIKGASAFPPTTHDRLLSSASTRNGL